MPISRLLGFAAAVLITPTVVVAQPVPAAYVCGGSQVTKIVGTSASGLLSAGNANFEDCLVGPDGRLYIANGTEIDRLDPTNKTTAKATFEFVATVPSTARGLAFNVQTLYINTAAGSVLKL